MLQDQHDPHEVLYAGADVPIADKCGAVAAHLLALSSSMHGNAAMRYAAHRYISVRERCRAGIAQYAADMFGQFCVS